MPCDVTNEAELDAVVRGDRRSATAGSTFVVHGVAFADHDDLGSPVRRDRRAKGFCKALDVSVYSLVALTRRAAPLMAPKGGGAS